MISAVGFDLDNTLYDQGQHVAFVFGHVARLVSSETGVAAGDMERTLLALWSERGPSYPRLFDDALERHGIWAARLVLKLIGLYHARVGRLEPYQGVRETLWELAREKLLFLVTDGHPEMQRRKIEALGIGRFFRPTVLTEAHGQNWRKPSPEPFRYVVRELAVPVDDCLYVGDNPDCDFAGAVEVGMKVARVLTGPFRDKPCEGVQPDHIIRSVSDLPHLVLCPLNRLLAPPGPSCY